MYEKSDNPYRSSKANYQERMSNQMLLPTALMIMIKIICAI